MRAYLSTLRLRASNLKFPMARDDIHHGSNEIDWEWCAGLCLHVDGVEQIEGVLLGWTWGGDHVEGRLVRCSTGTAADVADDGAEFVEQRLKTMDGAAVGEHLRMHFLESAL